MAEAESSKFHDALNENLKAIGVLTMLPHYIQSLSSSELRFIDTFKSSF